MKFHVCIKQVPDVYAPLQIRDGKIVQDSDRQVLNAYDASAVEEALVLTERHGGSVTAVLAGPEKASETLRKALAMGADDGVHLMTDGGDAYDSAVYARMLSAWFRGREVDVIAFGKQSQDTDSGLTGAMVARMLDLPYATNAVGLEIEDGRLIVRRQGDAGQEMLELPVPCVVTCSNDMNDPRIPSLKGIMASKKKPVEAVRASSLLEGVDDRPATRTLSHEAMPARKGGRRFTGDPAQTAAEVAGLLAERSGVI